ncbi:MAG: CopD family protein [Pseudomonadales bacterium]|nr:CopD family protein [Pseudomonadales bacterium]
MYEFIKSVHVTSVICWMGSSIVVAFLLWAGDLSRKQALILRNVMTISVLLVWAMGLWMAKLAGWYSEGWFQAKFALVVVLSGLHGFLSGTLRIAGKGETNKNNSFSLMIPWVIIGLVFVVVVLVISKPI